MTHTHSLQSTVTFMSLDPNSTSLTPLRHLFQTFLLLIYSSLTHWHSVITRLFHLHYVFSELSPLCSLSLDPSSLYPPSHHLIMSLFCSAHLPPHSSSSSSSSFSELLSIYFHWLLLHFLSFLPFISISSSFFSPSPLWLFSSLQAGGTVDGNDITTQSALCAPPPSSWKPETQPVRNHVTLCGGNNNSENWLRLAAVLPHIYEISSQCLFSWSFCCDRALHLTEIYTF